jgi:hypothetical protein
MHNKVLVLILLILGISAVFAVPREYVVVEVGTGTWCQYCPGAAMACHDLLNNGHAVAVIKNHNGDAYANTYSNARNTLYAITAYPTAFFDGTLTYVGGNATSSIYSTYLPYVNQRLAVASHYTLSATGGATGTTYSVQVAVAKPEADTNTNVKLMAVLTESHIPQVWFNQTTVENVNRLMVPDQNGTAISLGTGGSTNVSLNFTLGTSWVANNCELVLFLQNMTSKEILQAKKYSLTELAGGYPANLSSYAYPNTVIGNSASASVSLTNYASYAVTGSIGTSSSAFVPSVSSYNIPAHGVLNFTVDFVPATPQDYTGNLNITGNLWNYPNITIPLSGAGYRLLTDYLFSATQGTYTPITDGTSLGNESTGSSYFVDPAAPLGGTTVFSGPGFPIGFDFNYLGRTYDRLGIHSYGTISLGLSALTPSVNLTSTNISTPLSSVAAVTPAHLISRIAALGKSMRAQAGASIKMNTVGTAPNRECVIQWTNYKHTTATSSFSFQIRLCENGNRVKFVYGPFSYGGTNATSTDVGLRGFPDADASNFKMLTSATSWSNPALGTTNTSRMTLSSTTLPASGLTYNFIPLSSLPAAPVLTSPADAATGMPVAGFNLAWNPSALGAPPEYYAVYMSNDGEALYEQNYWETTGTTFNPVTQGGFTFGYDQSWFWTVEAINASGNAVVSPAYRFVTESSPGSQIPDVAIVTGDGNLGWPTVAGAQGYNIYRCSTPYGTYSLVGTTTDPNWTDPAYPQSKAFYKVTAILAGREVPVLLKNK